MSGYPRSSGPGTTWGILPFPVAGQRLRAQFGETEPGNMKGLQSSCERFGGLPEKIGRSAPKNEETRTQRPAVGEDAQDGKQIRPALHFVDDHDPAQGRQRGHRIGDAGKARWIFQVEIIQGIGRDDPPRERGLAALPWADQRDDAAA